MRLDFKTILIACGKNICKKKRDKEFLEALAEADISTLTQPENTAPSILVPKKYGTCVSDRGRTKQTEKTFWPLRKIDDVIDSSEVDTLFSNLGLTSRNYN